MTLTFLNLVVVTGILVGLIEGASASYKSQYSADVLISSLPEKTHIEQSNTIVSTAQKLPQTHALTRRYMSAGLIEANYKSRTDLAEQPDVVQVPIIGIDPAEEDQITHLSHLIIDGEYLEPGDEDSILMGNFLLKEYSPDIPAVFPTLETATVGDKVRLTIGEFQKELTITGVLKSKVEAVSLRAYVNSSLLRRLAGRTDFNVNEIAIQLIPNESPDHVAAILKQNYGFDKYALVQTWRETQGQFFADISDTFTSLGNIIGSISLIVASITIFIVIFINAVTRQKYIGILKGIGISQRSIIISYVFQSITYALIGAVIGTLFLYGFLEPYISAHPIDFPFSDGILVAPINGTIGKVLLVILSTLIAGYVPAKLIIRRNTLDSILGR